MFRGIRRLFKDIVGILELWETFVGILDISTFGIYVSFGEIVGT